MALLRVNELASPPPFVDYRLIEFGRHRFLVARFDALRREFGRSFGVHVRRLHETLYVARRLDASLYPVWYRDAPNDAVNRITSPNVRIVRASRGRDLLVLAVWWATSPLVSLKRRLYPEAVERRRRLNAAVKDLGRRAKSARKEGRSDAVGLRSAQFRARRADGFVRWLEPRQTGSKEYREEMATRPMRVELPPALERVARGHTERLGLDPNERIVTLHVRESGWRPKQHHGVDPRNCDIETYRPAVAELVRRGFRVVRVGDQTMVPIDWPGVLDLATHAERTDLLEVWCMLHSVFFLGCDSGATELAKLLGVPMLIVNVKHLQAQYPLHRSDLFIAKRLLLADEHRIASLRDQLGAKRRAYELHDPRYIDNSPEEILAAVVEMLDGENTVAPESPEQAEFRRLASSKGGEGRGTYLGEGRIAKSFVERYLDRAETWTESGDAVVSSV